VLYAAGIGAIWFCVEHLQLARWEWLLMIPVFLAGNFVEWGMHRFVMHRRINVFGLRQIYERHTREHHQYFTDAQPTIDTTREFRIVFFPWRVLVTLGIGGTILGSIAYKVIDLNAGLIVFMTMVGQYLIYESFHYCCHCHENWFVRNMPFVNTIRRHHTAHHNMGIMMKYNMNLSFPIADWFMGSSDLRRGLIGTLFNGYSEKHVKEELRPIIAKFKTDHSKVTLDGPQLTQAERQAMKAI
ncbi:sterol desaturase family protein, partial [Trinickia mobilis]|uniref:sterol desaturase family protein n=1 Tax=Trinickia mobilis TaxID=2816356 RepID=UPI001F5D9F13